MKAATHLKKVYRDYINGICTMIFQTILLFAI